MYHLLCLCSQDSKIIFLHEPTGTTRLPEVHSASATSPFPVVWAVWAVKGRFRPSRLSSAKASDLPVYVYFFWKINSSRRRRERFFWEGRDIHQKSLKCKGLGVTHFNNIQVNIKFGLILYWYPAGHIKLFKYSTPAFEIKVKFIIWKRCRGSRVLVLVVCISDEFWKLNIYVTQRTQTVSVCLIMLAKTQPLFFFFCYELLLSDSLPKMTLFAFMAQKLAVSDIKAEKIEFG